ncbi:MAG TPA: signal peptidase I [Actinomycetota bacterium]
MGPARPPPARAADPGMPPAPRERRRRRSEASQLDESWLAMLAEDELGPPAAPWAGNGSFRSPGASPAADAHPWWDAGPTGGGADDPGRLPWTGPADAAYGDGAHLEPPLVRPTPPPSPNAPPAWVEEPTAPGAPDPYASWPPAPPPGPSADPLTDTGRAANPAMPAWDYPTQPGTPPAPPAPEPWAGQGRPGATAAMPADPSWQAPWTCALDEVELPESRVDRFGDDRLHRRRSGRGRPRAGFWAEVPVLVVVAVVLAVLVKGFLVQAFYIPSRSMQPTLDVGDRVVVNRLSYRVGAPRRGQVVVFLRQTGGRATAPESPISWVRRAVAQGFGGAPPGSEDLIKRVIAGPGDVVQGSQGRVWVNGRALAEPYLRRGSFTSNFGPLRVPPGHYWVMGDNREDSSDSRVFGPIPRSSLVGHAVGTVWPPQRLGSL